MQRWVQTIAVVGDAPMVFAWMLVTFGITLVVTKSRVGAPLRRRFPLPPDRDGPGPDDKVVSFGHMIRCPMCTGYWIGIALSLPPLGLGPVALASPAWLPGIAGAIGWTALLAVLNGYATAAWCFVVHVVLVRLGSEQL